MSAVSLEQRQARCKFWESRRWLGAQTPKSCFDHAARWPQSPVVSCGVPSEKLVLCLGTDEPFTTGGSGWGGGRFCALRAACGLSLKLYFLKV